MKRPKRTKNNPKQAKNELLEELKRAKTSQNEPKGDLKPTKRPKTSKISQKET